MDVVEEDVAVLAARCYQKLHSGKYPGPDGTLRPIRGDTSKLMVAEGSTKREQELL